MTDVHQKQEHREAHFQFGANWKRFLELLDDERIAAAEKSLQEMLDVEDLTNMRFLDAGSGSGLFSLAARNLGASVISFDFDIQSVACTQELKKRYWPEDIKWKIEWGDVLDRGYVESLGTFDFVYSWGVLHHTGDMWSALENVSVSGLPGGKLFIAIYNDQRFLSSYWKNIKKSYNKWFLARCLITIIHAPYFLSRNFLRVLVTGTTKRPRGMASWIDIIDWLGGYPFEVARPEEIFNFYKKRNFSLEQMTTVDGRHGCNQFVFFKLKNTL